ncbi:hypothetical protein L195_g046364, partial [Trifolium pratense]
SSCAALGLSSSCAAFVDFSFWYRVSLIQVDISSSIYYRSDEDLDINVADPGV